jgi:hypothetical protein
MLDPIQKGHIDRTRTLLENSGVAQESKESMHDLLTRASLTANGSPTEKRLEHGAETMLALSNVTVRMAINLPKQIEVGVKAAIKEHADKCPHAHVSKAIIEWGAKGFIPSGAIRNQHVAFFFVLCLLIASMYWINSHFYRTAAKERIAMEETVNGRLEKTAKALATKTAETRETGSKERDEMELRIAQLIITAMKEN